MDETEMFSAVLNYAKRVARACWKDPEAESLAGKAAVKAFETWQPGRAPISRWVAFLVKREIAYEMRKRKRRHEKLKSELWWEGVYKTERETTLNISQEDYQLLVERYLIGWPLDVVAKRYGCGINKARAMVEAARARLAESLGQEVYGARKELGTGGTPQHR